MKTVIRVFFILGVIQSLTVNSIFSQYNFVDIDYNFYNANGIGTQGWMTENLNVSRFRNGDYIFEAKTETEWYEAGKQHKPAFCYYNNDPSNGKIYGKLYNWYAVNDPRGLAPNGWHIPSKEEWDKFIDFLGGLKLAGGKMKEIGTQHWRTPNTGASNESGFGGNPGGCRSHACAFWDRGWNAFWWSTTEGRKENNTDAMVYWITYDNPSVIDIYQDKMYGLSVRCVSDKPLPPAPKAVEVVPIPPAVAPVVLPQPIVHKVNQTKYFPKEFEELYFGMPLESFKQFWDVNEMQVDTENDFRIVYTAYQDISLEIREVTFYFDTHNPSHPLYEMIIEYWYNNDLNNNLNKLYGYSKIVEGKTLSFDCGEEFKIKVWSFDNKLVIVGSIKGTEWDGYEW